MTNAGNRQTAIRKLHYFSGITLTLFIGFYLLNQLFMLAGPEAHIALMERLRGVYRLPVIETILLLAVLIQVVSGIRLLFLASILIITGYTDFYSMVGHSFRLPAVYSGVLRGRVLSQRSNH